MLIFSLLFLEKRMAAVENAKKEMADLEDWRRKGKGAILFYFFYSFFPPLFHCVFIIVNAIFIGYYWEFFLTLSIILWLAVFIYFIFFANRSLTFFFLSRHQGPYLYPSARPYPRAGREETRGCVSDFYLFSIFFSLYPRRRRAWLCIFARFVGCGCRVVTRVMVVVRSRAVGCHLWFRVSKCVNAKINIATFRANRAALSRALFCVEVQRFVRCGAGSLTIHFRSLTHCPSRFPDPIPLWVLSRNLVRGARVVAADAAALKRRGKVSKEDQGKFIYYYFLLFYFILFLFYYYYIHF